MKQLRHRSVLSIPLDDCKLDDLLEKLNKCKEQHPDQTLEVSFDCEGGYEYSGPTEMNIEFYELETDEEYEFRIEAIRQKEVETHNKKMESLLKKKNLSDEEKDQLYEYIRNK